MVGTVFTAPLLGQAGKFVVSPVEASPVANKAILVRFNTCVQRPLVPKTSTRAQSRGLIADFDTRLDCRGSIQTAWWSSDRKGHRGYI